MMSAGASKLEKCSEELVDMGSFTLKEESENDVENKGDLGILKDPHHPGMFILRNRCSRETVACVFSGLQVWQASK